MGQYSLENWVNLLYEYITKADLTIENNDVNAREKIRNNLLHFISDTPQKYEFLDDIARKVIKELNDYDLNLAIGDISNITENLKKQRAIINLATDKAKEFSQEIQLEKLINIIDDTADKLDSIKETSEILSNKEKSFEDKISTLKNLIEDFKK